MARLRADLFKRVQDVPQVRPRLRLARLVLYLLPISTMVVSLTGEVVVALNIKNANVERLVSEVAALTGETKTEAVRRALEERRARLAFRVDARSRAERLQWFLEREVWPHVPEGERGRRLSSDEEDAILGYGPEGV
jgi:antitoxin VapB